MEKKLPKSFWIIISAAIVLVVVLSISIYLEKRPTPSVKVVPEISCEQKTSQFLTLGNPLRLIRWQTDQNALLISENEDRFLKEIRLINSEKKSQIYESGSSTDLCKLYENCSEARILDEIRDDLVVIISQQKLIKKNESKNQEKAEFPSFSLLVKSANNKTVPLNYSFCPKKGIDANKQFNGKWTTFFNGADYQLSIVNQSTGLILTGNLKQALKSINKINDVDLVSQNIIVGGFLDSKCVPEPIELGQTLFLEKKMIVWLPKKNMINDIIVSYSSGSFGEGWKREKDLSDIFKNDSGYLAAISNHQNRVLTSYFNTVTKRFENKTWIWEPSNLVFQFDFPSKYQQRYLSMEPNSESIVSSSGDENFEFFVNLGGKDTFLVTSPSFSSLGVPPKLGFFQNNRLLLLGDKINRELGISRFECKQIQ